MLQAGECAFYTWLKKISSMSNANPLSVWNVLPIICLKIASEIFIARCRCVSSGDSAKRRSRSTRCFEYPRKNYRSKKRCLQSLYNRENITKLVTKKRTCRKCSVLEILEILKMFLLPQNGALYPQKVLGQYPMVLEKFSSAQLQFKNRAENCANTRVVVYWEIIQTRRIILYIHIYSCIFLYSNVRNHSYNLSTCRNNQLDVKPLFVRCSRKF